ncbi:MAG TPA: PLP-dependent aminotransferase family protein [Candidatus Saccharimonadales bacterium]|nr:PLP-dependent aminotransferase family protein [Candidatus Saccharimonadales bacterium]
MEQSAASIVGVWEVHAPDAPFPWHVMTFTPEGTMTQSNPHEGNRDDSDSSGHGVWQVVASAPGQETIAGKFVEFKADRSTGAYIGKGEIQFHITVEGDEFTGTSAAYRYNAAGKLTRGPLSSPVHGKRITTGASVTAEQTPATTASPLKLSDYAEGAPVDALNELFHKIGRRTANMAAHGEKFISLAVGAPDNRILHLELERELHESAFREYGPAVLNYRFTAFEPAMQRFLASQGVVFDDQTGIQLTSGGMNAITLGVQAIINQGDVVLAEAPGFTGTLSVLLQAGAQVIQIPCGPAGVTPETVEAAFRQHKPKLIALMPDNQNPTGAVMPLAARQAIAKLAQDYNVAVVEDGAYYNLRVEGEALPPLQSFAPDRVLYATSFSKVLWPAIRVGALVAPKQIIAATSRMHFNNEMVTSPINAAIAERFISNDKLLRWRFAELQQTYRVRRDALLAALQQEFPDGSGYSWTHPAGGMFLWFTAPPYIDLGKTLDAALQNGVGYVPGNTCYTLGNEAAPNTARLNFASSSPEDIQEGVRRLSKTLGV